MSLPALVLLNGPPAVGKSTIASRLCHARPLSLNLDIDVVRAQLGDWLEAPIEDGLAARRLALAMARTHLEAGHLVVVPQFLARVDFIDDLEALAADVGVPFVEVVLLLPRAEAIAAFAIRSDAPQGPTHADAAALVDASASPDPLGEMYDDLERLVASRPQATVVEVIRGDVESTLAKVEPLLR